MARTSLLTLPSSSSSSSSTFRFSSSTPLKRFSYFPRKPPKTTPRRRLISLSATSVQSPTSDSPLLSKLNIFWEWLLEQGVVSANSPVRPALVPEGLGLVAQKDISRNEVVLEVPQRFWINPDAVAASEIGSVCGGLKPWVSVALFLIREKLRDDSPWRVYLDVLPDSTDSTLFWWV